MSFRRGCDDGKHAREYREETMEEKIIANFNKKERPKRKTLPVLKY